MPHPIAVVAWSGKNSAALLENVIKKNFLNQRYSYAIFKNKEKSEGSECHEIIGNNKISVAVIKKKHTTL